ncbi:MAG: hypothetical protein O7J95_00885 [Planctomycetota bacterium]|nr:hypothetical protein [Planctomycetota bacterium]
MKKPTLLAITLLVLVFRGVAPADPGDLLGFLPFSRVSPQDIARDVDGTFWVTNFLDGTIHHYSADLKRQLDVIRVSIGRNSFLTGIAVNSAAGTILVTEAGASGVKEIERDGTPTGRVIPLPLDAVVNPNGFSTARGLAFDPQGAGGEGSLYVVEPVGTLIYEISLAGDVIRTFTHPDDPDGFPGAGAGAGATDIDLIYRDGALRGFYVTGSRGGRARIVRLDVDGGYTGISVPLSDASGTVSGILRQEFPHPVSGEPVDTFVCVVESNARFALLEGGEPDLREVFDYRCDATGQDVTLSWTRRQVYDRIEVLLGCDVLTVLPGDATSWSGTFELDGVYEIAVRVVRGDTGLETETCTVVIGPGQVLQVSPLDADYPVDIAWDGGELLLVSDAFAHVVHIYSTSLESIGPLEVPETFTEEDDVITGVARSRDGESFFLYNTTQHRIGRLNLFGELLEDFPVELPNLEEDPEKEADLGIVIGMTWDPEGDAGRGSLWLVEAVDDTIHEIALDGRRIRSLPHPYRDVVPAPRGSSLGSFSGGVARVSGTSPTRLYLGGGTRREFRQPRIFELDTEQAELVRGSEFPTAGIRAVAQNSSLTLEHAVIDGRPRLFVLPLEGSRSKLLEVEPALSDVPPPTFLTCRQRSLADDVEITFRSNAAYDQVEIIRDCRPIAVLEGTAELFVDRDVEPGPHEYAVRGVAGGRHSPQALCRLRVGVGAILERQFAFPVRSPRQLTRDPLDGSFYVATNWPGHEREVYHFDRGLRFLARRETSIEEPWEIASLAVRRTPEGERLLYFITWQQPVPLGKAGRESFFFASETLDGIPTGRVTIDPPRPTNGFVTFPTGLAWNEASDSFYFLERNSKTFVELDPGGSVIRTFPHPAPPFQNFVFNLGLSMAPRRGSIFITGSGRSDLDVTRVLEMTLDGRLTGYEIPLGELGLTVTGISLTAHDLVAVGTSRVADIVRLKAFPEVPEPFVRGDSNGDGRVDLTDAIVTLEHLFRGRPEPACPDGADSDDSGDLSITDPIVVLLRLFLGGDPMPEPYPDPGQDPTPDGLGCR